MTFDTFASNWIGKQVNPDGAYGFQCVDLILEYLKELEGLTPAAYGNAIDYANPAPAVAAVTTRVPDIQKGDIVVLYGINGNTYGHITIASGRVFGNLYEALEQNGATGSGDGIGGNAIRFRYIDTGRIAAILRPKTTVVETVAPVSSGGQVLYLPAVPLWKVYNEGGPYTTGHQIGNLTPARYNGLNYAIVRWASATVAIIDTGAYGRVAIYVAPETGATIK